jgi:hypothetical protein
VIRLSLPNGFVEETTRKLRRKAGRPVATLVTLAGGAPASEAAADERDRELVAS